MILREETVLDAPPLLVQRRLIEQLRLDGLEVASAASFDDERTLLVRAGVAGVTKSVAMASLPAYLRGDVTVIPIRWVATGPLGELFPTLEANLEVGPTDDGRTLLVLLGSYRPPLGRLGAKIDHIVMHNVGSATTRGFLSRVSAQIMASHAAQPAAQAEFGDADAERA